MITVVNLQRKVKIDSKAFRSYVDSLPIAITEAAASTFSVAFISDRRMIELNKFFRGKDSTTDVLSFPHEPDEFDLISSPPYEEGTAAASTDGVVLPPFDEQSPGSSDFLGDIVISAEQAQRQAKENKLTLENEIKQLILHGLLHLCGYDHETDDGEMNSRELVLRGQLNI
ncbi:MAG TPA: rRNA maturation RNase YbeY [Pyrinomonadaceae bacterium]|nr:rRNA maturation RNase YbeY [Pyrinomonadaceae bacterium]